MFSHIVAVVVSLVLFIHSWAVKESDSYKQGSTLYLKVTTDFQVRVLEVYVL